MKNIKTYIKSAILGLPLLTIFITSFLPLQIRAQQSLVLFTLVWFNVFFLFDVIGK